MSYKNIILCDLDGTLANVGHRLHYLKNPDGTLKPQKERDWGSFHKACVDDAPYEDVIEVVSSVFNARQDNDLYILSGRNEVVREETEAWLCRHFPDYYEPDPTVDPCVYLHMRKANDFRPDTEVKLDMVRELGFTPDNVLCIFDDRQCVVDMWRENGFRCLQVNAWEE